MLQMYQIGRFYLEKWLQAWPKMCEWVTSSLHVYLVSSDYSFQFVLIYRVSQNEMILRLLLSCFWIIALMIDRRAANGRTDGRADHAIICPLERRVCNKLIGNNFYYAMSEHGFAKYWIGKCYFSICLYPLRRAWTKYFFNKFLL